MSAQQILFIDGLVESPDTLIAGLDPSIEVVMLNDQESGLKQMARALQERQNVSSVHVMSHGAPGGIWLGNGPVATATLPAEGVALAAIKASLAPGADILLYGCDVAAGSEGQDFIIAFADATGAEVAASIDSTGSDATDHPSDWSLEASTGSIETEALAPTDYQHDLGYWQYVGLTGGANPWAIQKGSWYTARFDSNGGKWGKGGVGTKVGSYNVSNLYQSRYDWGGEAVEFTFKGSTSAVNGQPWYVNNWDWDAGYAILWGAYANATPWQVVDSTATTSARGYAPTYNSVTINQNTSFSVNLKNITRDDYYGQTSDFWKYFTGAVSTVDTRYATQSGQSFAIGSSADKVVTYTTSNDISLKGRILIGTVRWTVDDGRNGYGYNPDYWSAYAQYRKGSYVEYIYGDFNDDAVTWPTDTAPAPQTWANASRSEYNFGRGAKDPDAIDKITGYSLVSIVQGGTDVTNAVVAGTHPWLKISGTTLYVVNLTPENAGITFDVTVRATSSGGAGTNTIDKSFTLTTGNKAQVNDAPTSVNNSVTLNEDTEFNFGAGNFVFTDRDKTVGNAQSTLAADGATLQSIQITELPDPSAGTLKVYRESAWTDLQITSTTTTVNGTTSTVYSYPTVTVNELTSGYLKFVPLTNYSGAANFKYKVYDGIAYAGSASTMTIYITSINDKPIISAYTNSTSNPLVAVTDLIATLTDTAVADTSFTVANTATQALTGYLTTIDTESTTATLSIDGSSTPLSKDGQYGTLTLTAGASAGTATWAYTPNAAAINKLASTATDTFKIKATDAHGGSSYKDITITVTGVNDRPVVAQPIDDQTYGGSGPWRYQLPANTFSDAEGAALAITASGMPTGITFDANTRTFNGTPTQAGTFAIQVSASDGTLSVSDTFNLVVSNRAPVLAKSIDYVAKTTHEVSTITVSSTQNAGDSLSVKSGTTTLETFTLSAGSLTAAQVYTAVSTALATPPNGWTVEANGTTVTLTSTTSDTNVSDIEITGAASKSVTKAITQGVDNTSTESVVLTFNAGYFADLGLSIGNQSLTLPQATVVLTTTSIESQLSAALVSSPPSGYTAEYNSTNHTVTLTATSTGQIDDLAVGGAGSSAFNAPSITQGTVSNPEVVVLTFNNTATINSGSTITVGDKSVTLQKTLTSAEIAAQINSVTYTGYTTSVSGSAVKFISTVSGNTADINITGVTNSVSTTDGAATWSYTLPSGIFSDPDGDSLTYAVTANVDGSDYTFAAGSKLAFNSGTAVLSGDGTALEGVITVTATDTAAHATSTTFGLQVHDGVPTVTLTAGTLPGTAGLVPFANGAGSFSYTLPSNLFSIKGAQPVITTSALPSWLSFNASTQTFSGNPPGNAIDPVVIDVTATSSAGAVIQQIKLDLTNWDDPLTVQASIPTQSITPSWSGYTLPSASTIFANAENISASEPVTGYSKAEYFNGTSWVDMTTGTATVNTSGLAFNASTGEFTGYPTSSQSSLLVRVTGKTALSSTGTAEFSFNLPGNTAGAVTLSSSTAVTNSHVNVGSVLTPVLADADGASAAAASKVYQWQFKAAGTSSWEDIAGTRGTGSTLELSSTEAKADVRVVVSFTDDRGFVETATVSNANVLTVNPYDAAGSVTIIGNAVPGDNLLAQVTDPNGMSTSTVSYAWYRSAFADFSGETQIGTNSPTLTLTNEEGSQFVRVKVSYTDDDGFVTSYLTVSANGGAAMRKPPIAPVATNDVGGAPLVEKGGVGNGGSGGTHTLSGNVLTVGTDDSDANIGEADDTTYLSVKEVLLGENEGAGEPGQQTGTVEFSENPTTHVITAVDDRSYHLVGLYGTLDMSYNGAYTYELDESNVAVQSLAVGQHLDEWFNYRIDDGQPAFLSDTATLHLTINGANDAPTITVRVDNAIDSNGNTILSNGNPVALPFASVLEDASTFIPTNKLVFSDPDMGATGSRASFTFNHDNDSETPDLELTSVNNDFVVTLSVRDGRLVVPTLPAKDTHGTATTADDTEVISVVGSDTSKLTLKGPMEAINTWLSNDVIKYLSAPNSETTDVLTVTADDGYGAVSSTDHSIAISAQNDAPVLDMNGPTHTVSSVTVDAGFSFNVMFRPRGDSQYIVDRDATITDPDAGDKIIGATISLGSGALDNQFGTTYETLSTNYANTFTLGSGPNTHTFTLTGNGTPNMTIEGLGTHAEYETILKTIKYINENPNAYGGVREVTIRLTDNSTQVIPGTSDIDTSSRSDSNKAILISAQTQTNSNQFNVDGNPAVAVGMRIFVDGADSGNVIAQVLDNSNYIANKPIKLLTPTSTIRLVKTAVIDAATSGTNTLTLQVSDAAIKVGQSIYLDGVLKGQVSAVGTDGNGHTTVTTTANHALAATSSSPLTVTFETTLPLLETKSTASEHVAATTTSSTALALAAIDIYIEAGQHIFVNGVDSGKTVASVVHDAITKTTVTASDTMSLSTSDVLTFRTFATNLTPDATAYINNYWTTEVDLNGVLSSGRDYETGFTEGQTTGTEIAAASASLDNQSFKIKSLVVTLSNPEVGDSLYVNSSYTIGLLGRGISTAVTSHNHTIDGQTVSVADTVTLSAIDPTVGVSSADMQMALRATLFKNTSENPDVTPRVVNVVATDITNETGVNAHTTVYITPLNDAPILSGYFLNDLVQGAYTLTAQNRDGDFSVTMNEGGVYALNSDSSHLDFVPLDADNDVNTLTYTVKVLPGQNLTLFRDSNNDEQVDAGEALAIDSTFTHGELTSPNGTIKVIQTGVDSVFNGFDKAQAEALMNSLTYENKLGTDGLASTLASSGMRKVTLASSSKWNDSGAVSSVTNDANNVDITETASTSAVYSTSTLADPGSHGYKSLTFKVANVIDGKSEVLHFGSVDVPLTVGSFVSNGVVFSVSKGTETVSSATQTYFLVTVAKSSYAIGLELADGGQDGSLPIKTTLDLTLNPVNDAPVITATAATTPTFTEGGAAAALFTGVSVSTNDTSGPAQTITEVTIQVSGLKDGLAEKLHLGDQAIDLSATSASDITVNTSYTVTRTVTVTNGVATVTLGSSQTSAVWQSLLGSLKYSNTSTDPTGTSRTVTIVGLKDSGGTANTGVDTATVSIASTVALVAVNSVPVFASGAGYFEQTVLDGGTKVISTAQLSATDADGSAATARLSYSLGTEPVKGKLFIDANGNGVADFGESIVIKGADASVDYSVGGQYRTSFTQADVDAGQLKYAANGTSIGDDPFTVVVSDGIAAPVSHVFTAHVITASTVRGAVNTSTPATPTDVFTSVAVAPLPSGQTIKSLTFTVSGVVDAGEKLTIGGTDVALLNGTSVTVGDVTYTVSVDAQGKATVVVTDNAAPGFTNTTAATLIDGITYSNSSSPATAGTRVIELVSTTNYNGSNETLPETPINQGSVTATPTNAVTDIAAGTSVISSTDGSKPLFSSVDVNMPTGEAIDTLTFTVDGVLDGNNEVLTIDGTQIALGAAYPHTVTATGVAYSVTLGQDGQVLVTAVYTSDLSEAAIEATLASVRYENNEVPVTAGQRLVSLASMGDSAHFSDTIAVDLMSVVNVKPSLDPFGTAAHTALDTAVPTGGAVQSLTFTVDGVVDDTSEVLKINGQEIPLVNGVVGPIDGCTYTVTVVDGKATVTVTATPALSENAAQTLLDSVSYSNHAEPPTSAVKTIELTQVGVLATPTATTATLEPISGTDVSAAVGSPAFDPFSAADITQAKAAITGSTTSLTFTVTGVKDGASEVLKFGAVTVPLVNGTVGPIDGITYTVTVVNGTATVVASGLTGAIAEAQGEALVNSMTYQNTATPATTGDRTVSLASVSDGSTSTPVNVGGDVQTLGELPTPQSVDPFGSAAVTAVDNAVPSGSTVGALTFTVKGVADGAKEVFTINGQAVPLVTGTVTVGGVTYDVTVDGNGTATITVSKAAPGFSEAQAKAMVDGASYTNTDATPTASAKTISLTSLDVITAGVTSTTTLSDVSSGTVIGGAALSPFSSADLSSANAAISGTPASLTFTVAGVKDGANEVLKFGSTVVPLVAGTVGPIDGITYTVTVVNGTATVVATGMTSESAAESLVSGVTYQNTDANPTVGERTVSLSKVSTTTVTGVSGTAQMGSGSVPNATPVVTVHGFTMLEGGVVNVTKDILSVTDADDALETLSFTLTGLTDATLFRDSNYNGVVNTGEEIGLGLSFSYQDIVNGVLKIRHNGEQPTSNVLSVTVSDGTTRVTGSHAFTVTNVNDAPTGLPRITGAAQRTGVLQAVTTGVQDADLFTSNPPSFTYQWKADGADISGATGSSYTVARADIGKKITVQVSYTDAQGYAESVLSLPTGVVQNVNEAPTLTAGAITVAEGGSVTLTPTQVIASDGDGLGSNHVLTLCTVPVHGTLYLDQNGNANLDAGEELSSNSQFAWNDLAAGKIRFKHDGSELDDSFQFKLSDSEAQTGLIDFSITRIAVNDAPVISGLSTVDGASVVNDLLTYAITGERKLLDQGDVFATVSDSDSTDFSGGVLRVSIAQNRNAAKDALSIETISTDGHAVSLDGANVKYDTTVIGTVSGGTGANDLEVTFNGSASAEKVAAVIRAVAFTNLERVPASSSRMVTFELSDGDGSTSVPAQVSINLTASAAPIIQNNASEIYVQENNRDVGYFVALDPGNKALTYSISTATTSDNADRGKFVISAAGLLQFIAAPDYEAPGDVGTDNTYQVIVKATNPDGLLDESILSVHVTNATTGPGEHEDTSPTLLVATVNGAQMGLTFADANLLDGTNLPSASQFTVTSNGQAVGVTGYLVNTATKVVTLTLARSIAYGETVLVSFTDPSAGNDANTLQDIYGNDVASFAGQSALVLTPQPVAVSTGGGAGGAPVAVIVPKTDTNVVVTQTVENAVKSIVYVAADGTKQVIEGDGNGDGIADSLQNAVLSVPFKLSDKVSTADTTVAESFITLVTASVNGKVSSSEVAAITEINQMDAPANLPPDVNMPLGLIGFKSTIPTIGANGSFSLYVDPTLPFNGYWKQNGQGVWTNLAASSFGGGMSIEDGKMRIDFVIQDGGEFDEDGVANGVIVDPGALGELPLSVMGTAATMPVDVVWF